MRLVFVTNNLCNISFKILKLKGHLDVLDLLYLVQVLNSFGELDRTWTVLTPEIFCCLIWTNLGTTILIKVSIILWTRRLYWFYFRSKCLIIDAIRLILRTNLIKYQFVLGTHPGCRERHTSLQRFKKVRFANMQLTFAVKLVD